MIALIFRFQLLEEHRNSNRSSLLIRIGNILRNPFYKGEFTWSGIHCSRAQHQAIVSPDLWDLVQHKLENNNKTQTRLRTHRFTYQDLMFCKCGRAIVGEKKVKKSGRTYIYYRCGANKCPYKKYVTETAVNDAYAYQLDSLHFEPELIDSAAAAISKVDEADERLQHTQVRLLKGQIEKLKSRKSGLYKDQQDGVIDLNEYKQYKREFEAELIEKEMTLAGLVKVMSTELDRARIDYLSDNQSRLFRAMPPERKRAVVEAVFDNKNILN